MINKFLLKEGNKPVLYALVFTVISAVFICNTLAVIALLITLSLLYIFKVPFRSYSNVSDILSPLDGQVLAIDQKNESQIIYIQTSLCDAHILRAPKSGHFEVLKNKKGINLDANSFKAKTLNQNLVIKFDDICLDFLVGQYNICLSLDEQKEYNQNEKFGVFTHGLTKITLNKNIPSKVKIGQKVYAGISVLA